MRGGVRGREKTSKSEREKACRQVKEHVQKGEREGGEEEKGQGRK